MLDPMSAPITPETDYATVHVSGYGADGRAGTIDFGAGFVHRAGRAEPIPAEGFGVARAAAQALHALGDCTIQPSQFTHGEVRFEVHLGGARNTVRFTDDGSGLMDAAMQTLLRLAMEGP